MKARQQAILSFIASYVAEEGYPPSIREIGKAVGLSSSSSVSVQLEALRTAGKVTWKDGQPRTIRVVGTA